MGEDLMAQAVPRPRPGGHIPVPSEAQMKADMAAARRAANEPADLERPYIPGAGRSGPAVDPYAWVKSQLDTKTRKGALRHRLEAALTAADPKRKRELIEGVLRDAVKIRNGYGPAWIKAGAERLIASLSMALLVDNPSDDPAITAKNLRRVVETVRALEYAKTNKHEDANLYHDLAMATALEVIFRHPGENDVASLSQKSEKYWETLKTKSDAALTVDVVDVLASLYLIQKNIEKAKFYAQYGIDHSTDLKDPDPKNLTAKKLSLHMTYAKVLVLEYYKDPKTKTANLAAATHHIGEALALITGQNDAAAKLQNVPEGWEAIHASPKAGPKADGARAQILELLMLQTEIQVQNDHAVPGGRSTQMAHFINQKLAAYENHFHKPLVAYEKIPVFVHLQREEERFRTAMADRRAAEKQNRPGGHQKATQELNKAQAGFGKLAQRARTSGDHETAVRAAHWQLVIRTILVDSAAHPADELTAIQGEAASLISDMLPLIKDPAKVQEMKTRLESVQAEVLARQAVLQGDRQKIQRARALFQSIVAGTSAVETPGHLKDPELHVRALLWANSLTVLLRHRNDVAEGSNVTDLVQEQEACRAVQADLKNIDKDLLPKVENK